MAHFKEILNHSRNYLFASLANKALAFISIPVYTRLLSTEEYGIVSIFIGVSGILMSILTFSMDRSISRYYFDQKDLEDFGHFNGTSLILSVCAFLINSILIFIFSEQFGKMVGLEKNVIFLLIPYTLINIIGLTFEQIFGPQKKSKTIAVFSLYQVYLGFGISTTLILLLTNNKYYGFFYGQIIAGFIISIFWIIKIKPYFKICFEKKYIQYIFTYSVPLIPYALSGVIIDQFGKIAIGSEQGLSNAGFYTLAQTIGGLVFIIISITHQAWNPYYMDYMNSKNYKQLDSDFNRIFKLTILTAFVIAAFGKEIGLFLAKDDFAESLYLIPIFTIGYIFYQLSYTYLRNFGFAKKTHLMTITVLISGISNVVFNKVLIPNLKDLGAALSFVFSYFIMAIVGWIFNKYFVKLHATSLLDLLKPIAIVIPFYLSLYLLSSNNSLWITISIKFFLIAFLFILLFYNERNNLLVLIKLDNNKLK